MTECYLHFVNRLDQQATSVTLWASLYAIKGHHQMQRASCYYASCTSCPQPLDVGSNFPGITRSPIGGGANQKPPMGAITQQRPSFFPRCSLAESKRCIIGVCRIVGHSYRLFIRTSVSVGLLLQAVYGPCPALNQCIVHSHCSALQRILLRSCR